MSGLRELLEARLPEWIDDPGVKCRGVTWLFYPESSATEVNQAKNVCNGANGHPVCPHRTRCLHYAIDNREFYGVWGGMSERDRRKVRAARRKHGDHIYTFQDVAFPGILRIPRRRIRPEPEPDDLDTVVWEIDPVSGAKLGQL